MPKQIAIIGSGPAGCYLAATLQKGIPDCEITIFDRQPTPYGLIRYGVAADHQHTKTITRQFDRLFQNPNIRFAGNIEIGGDINLETLQENYDTVVLATGIIKDRPLNIPGHNLPGTYGASRILLPLNTHPDHPRELPKLGENIVIVGGGNVAMDCLRFLVKNIEHHEHSDISDPTLASYQPNNTKKITLLNRSDTQNAKSDPQMLKELAALPRANYTITGTKLDTTTTDRQTKARHAALTELTSPNRAKHPGPQVEICFNSTPQKIVGENNVQAIQVKTGEQTREIPADTIITAIGFEAEPGLLTDVLAKYNQPQTADTGRITDNLYRTGWAKRGPNGAIPENRQCAKAVAEEIMQDTQTQKNNTTKPGFHGLPTDIQQQSITFTEWEKINQHETATAHPGRCRTKIHAKPDMLKIAK